MKITPLILKNSLNDHYTMEQSESVCVAVHIRPLIDTELGDGCTPCLDVTPGAPQVRCTDTLTSIYNSKLPLEMRDSLQTLLLNLNRP
jgi:hypothetical protein